jgi:hypothetical protein
MVVAKATAIVFAVEVVVVAFGSWSVGCGSEVSAGGGGHDACLQSWWEWRRRRRRRWWW